MPWQGGYILPMPSIPRVHAACILLLTTCNLGHAQVYACRDEAGRVWYSDLGCRSGAPLALDAPQVVEFAAVPPGKSQAGPSGEHSPGHSQSAAARAIAHRKQACTQARQVLERLRERRRKGYALEEQVRLEAQQKAARRDRQRYCR